MSLRDWQDSVLEGVRRSRPFGILFRESDGGASLEDRLGVYVAGYSLRLGESLADDFPLTERLLGRMRFAAAVRDFLPVEKPYEMELGEASPNFAAWLGRGAAPALSRALRLDTLAVEARRAEDSPAGGSGGSFGLHPSARFHRDGARGYAVWRAHGSVCRERIDARTERLLGAFAAPASLEELGQRLEALGEGPEFVQAAVAQWSAVGMICVS